MGLKILFNLTLVAKQKLYPPEHVSYEYNSRFGSECINGPFALNRDTLLLPAAWQPGLFEAILSTI